MGSEIRKAKRYYLAIFERGEDGYYATFPDLPGCVAAGDDLQAAATNAESALLLHISGLLEDGDELPPPVAAADAAGDPEVTEIARMLIGVEAGTEEKTRVNVMLDRSLVSAIDAVSDNRSRFLSEAARTRLRELAG